MLPFPPKENKQENEGPQTCKIAADLSNRKLLKPRDLWIVFNFAPAQIYQSIGLQCASQRLSPLMNLASTVFSSNSRTKRFFSHQNLLTVMLPYCRRIKIPFSALIRLQGKVSSLLQQPISIKNTFYHCCIKQECFSYLNYLLLLGGTYLQKYNTNTY